MKFTTSILPLGLISGAYAHAIMQKISVNGVDQGQLKGVRAPTSDNPIQDVNDSSFACNKDIVFTDSNVISIPAGAKVGGWWGHVIGGAQGSNDPDNPIAASHKGPIIYYLAKVDNAATTGTTGLQWFKVGEDGLSGSTWAVDTMIANGGWHYFTLPSCIAPGDYLLRVELIALHSAGSSGQAQFYMECAQVRITGSGTNTGANKVSFPGAYSASAPGILISIYDNSGKPTNGGRPYTIPGPAVLTCGTGGGSNPTTTQSTVQPTTLSTRTSSAQTTTTRAPVSTTTTTRVSTPTTTSASGGGSGAPLYGQCGGQGWTGATTCAQGTCKASNQYYSQCLP